MARQDEILQDMLASLQASDRSIDVGIGSLARKIYDPVAEAIAERDIDSYLHQYAYDLDAKSGADLDEMVRLFGFSRLPARRSSGELVFSRPSPSATSVRIPAASQVQNDPSSDPVVSVSTLYEAVIPSGELSVTVPAIAVNAGADGNVSANDLTVRRTAIAGVTAVTNPTSFTGGVDAESDEHLRRRFRETVFRSLAGTHQMFSGVALDDPDVTQVNVVGSVRRFRERIEVSGGTATSTVQDAAYIVPDSAMLGADLNGGDVLTENVNYTVDYAPGSPGDPPEITAVAGGMDDGIYDLEFEYVPLASRNDLVNGITNRVDVYVRGERVKEATSTLVFDENRQFNTTPGDSLLRTNFYRSTEVHPTDGNFFIPYPLVPVVDPSVDGQIQIDGKTYIEGTHYWLVYDITNKGQAPRSLAGIELRSQANGSALADPADLSVFTVDYSYNEVPRSIEAAIGGRWRVLNQDVWVHQGTLLRLNLHFAVILTRGYTQAQVEDELFQALSRFIDSSGFNSVLQASDLLYVAHSVAGVDSIRFLTDADNPSAYAIQRVSAAGGVVETYASPAGVDAPRRALDVMAGDSETPVLNEITLDVRAQNSWGTI